jgi:hypothetical protein
VWQRSRELELALFCLLENALEAGGGTGARALDQRGSWRSVEIADDGPGWTRPAAQAREPFFTTKPAAWGSASTWRVAHRPALAADARAGRGAPRAGGAAALPDGAR